MAKLTVDDIKPPLEISRLVEALNKIDAETDKLEARMMFCREHNFSREADHLQDMISARSRVFVTVCNALGKYF